VYYPEGVLEPIRKPLFELVKEDSKIRESLMAPQINPCSAP
jgi:hypothetical protein